MDNKHTPGPWRLFDGKSSSEKGGQLIISGLPRLNIIARVYEDTAKFGEFTADAHLLAAAPDLLAAVRLALPLLNTFAANEAEGDDEDDETLILREELDTCTGAIIAAIAKAEGR